MRRFTSNVNPDDAPRTVSSRRNTG
jgi:hypothetical protein